MQSLYEFAGLIVVMVTSFSIALLLEWLLLRGLFHAMSAGMRLAPVAVQESTTQTNRRK